MNSFSSSIAKVALTAVFLAPSISQAKTYQSIQDPQLQSYATQAKQEACRQQGQWLSAQVSNGVRIKLETALVLPKIVTISITPDPHPEESTDYMQETNIDGDITTEPIRLELPIRLKDFSIRIMNGTYISQTNCNS